MTNDENTMDLEAEFTNVEERLASASRKFQDELQQQHRELSVDFYAADQALEEFAQEVEKGDGATA
jgi:hypothetical protein